MSYTQHFSETISGSVRISVSYPASERGGTTSETAYWSEDVNIALVVDTEPFDDSVSGVKQNVDLLTGSIVATGAAHVISKKKASAMISETIIAGFFGNIRSEIKQQMIEVQALLAPKLQELKAMAERCKAVENQMAEDFSRISQRYSQLFIELDQEMKRRVGSLDKQSFDLTGQATRTVEVARTRRLATVTSVTAGEKEETGAILLLSVVKQHAMAMISGGQEFIRRDRILSDTLSALLAGETVKVRTTHFIPVLLAVYDGVDSALATRAFYRPGEELFSAPAKWASIADDSASWKSMLGADGSLVGDYLKRRLDQMLADASDLETEARVADEMRKLWVQWRND